VRSALFPVLLSLLLLALASAAAGPPAAADERVPAPRFDRVNHARPDARLALSPEVGDERMIRSLAGQLKQEDPKATLAGIYQWMHKNLKYDKQAAYTWRTLADMLKARTYGGCADHAAVFGTLARAAGIPTIWVKTMDVAWIEAFRAGRSDVSSGSGHVFLEVWLDGRWALLDAQAMLLYRDYDVSARILPGNRFAYDKGDDPYPLVLSCRWDLWKAQTEIYFRTLDLGMIPYSDPADLLAPWRVWIAGNDPLYRYAQDACSRFGYHVARTFNRNWDTNLRAARGNVLMVTCDGTTPVLPRALWPTLLPPGWQAVVQESSLPEAGYLSHHLPDGTRVILVTGQDLTSIQVGVARALTPSTSRR
jgi:hypothetical protein